MKRSFCKHKRLTTRIPKQICEDIAVQLGTSEEQKGLTACRLQRVQNRWVTITAVASKTDVNNITQPSLYVPSGDTEALHDMQFIKQKLFLHNIFVSIDQYSNSLQKGMTTLNLQLHQFKLTLIGELTMAFMDYLYQLKVLTSCNWSKVGSPLP